MGRGRKGMLNQSTKKLNPKRHNQIAMFVGLPDRSDEKKSIYVKTFLNS